MLKCLVGILFICLSVHIYAQRVSDTIPYEFIYNKIIISVSVNGQNVKYIVDTGGQTGTTRNEAVMLGAKATGAIIGVGDINNKQLRYEQGYLENIRFSTNCRLRKLKTLIFPPNGFFKTLGVVGILGSDAFAESVITFDALKQVMIINHPYRPSGLRMADGIEIVSRGTYPIININIGGKMQEALFDTGAQGFFILSENNSDILIASRPSIKIAEAWGVSGVGIGGMADPSPITKVDIPEITVLNKTFTNVGSISVPLLKNILGVDLLKYGKVTIDYMRHRFYFFPYGQGITDMGGAPVTWNVDILPVGEHFRITTVWETMKDKVSFGDRVTNINGIQLSNVELSEMAIDAIMEGIRDNSAYIVVEKDGNEKRVEIRREGAIE